MQPSNVPGGQLLTPAVEVAIQDASGNTVASASNSVTLAIGTNPSGGRLLGTTTVAAVNGVATFSAIGIDKAGSGYTVVAAVAGLTGTTSGAFAVTIGPPARLAFTVQPTNAVAAQAISPAVQVIVQDQGGNTVPTATSAVTLAIGTNPVGGTLSGTVTANAASGLASFSALTINKTGAGYTLAATGPGLSGATSSLFAISPGAAAQLVFTAQPSTVVAGRPIAPAVQVTALDAEGNVATEFVGSVTMAIGTNPNAGALAGTLTTAAVGGIASFGDLAVDSLGNGYTLVATAGALTATSAAFIVGTTGISYSGGPIIYAPKVAAIYWSSASIYAGGPTPGTSGSPIGRDETLVAFYLNNLGGTPYFNITTTYSDATNSYIQNVVTYTQYWADATGPPSAPTDSEIQVEIERGFTTGALTYDASTMYAVFTGSGINLGGGFGTDYCAYHFYFVDGMGRNVKYAAMPYDYDYAIGPTTAGCSVTQQAGSANADPAGDAEVNTLSHELAETVTDENLNAWFVTSGPYAGQEMADLCNFDFGTYYYATDGSAVNQFFGGRFFLVQMLWPNAENPQGTPLGCQQAWTAPASLTARRSRALRVRTTARAAGVPGLHIMRPRTSTRVPVAARSARVRPPG